MKGDRNGRRISITLIGASKAESQYSAGVLEPHLNYICKSPNNVRMPNTFAPRAFSNVVKDRTERLRFNHEGDEGEVKEWHAIVDLLSAEYTDQFVEEYARVDEIPDVIDLNGAGE